MKHIYYEVEVAGISNLACSQWNLSQLHVLQHDIFENINFIANISTYDYYNVNRWEFYLSSYINGTSHFVMKVCRVVNHVYIWVSYPCLPRKITLLTQIRANLQLNYTVRLVLMCTESAFSLRH